MYKRQLISTLGLISLCLILLGAGFFTLYYQYHLREMKKLIQQDIAHISNYVEDTLTSPEDIYSRSFRAYLASVAKISDTSIVLSDVDGNITFATGKNLNEATAIREDIPLWAVNNALQTPGVYSYGMSTFGDLFTRNSYVAGVSILAYIWVDDGQEMIQQNTPCGLLFIATDASYVQDFLIHAMQLFLLTAAVVLLISLVISSLTVQRMLQPLREMSAAAYRFAHGELDARVKDYSKRDDEVGELATAFNAMADSLAQSERKRSEFVANVSHELKTPMTTIAGFAEGILDGTISPEREKESLEVISSETRRLSRLVRRMLELSRLQSSERMAAQEQFDVSEILLRVLVSLEAKVNEKELEIQTDLPPGAVMVWGDPDAVTQVCYNLLDNAIKFSIQGGTLTLKIVSKNGKAHISIANQGETISADQLPHIFDRFHKADESRSAHREGVGLGLYIVKTILNTYKENITVTSENGITEFTFTLSEV